MLPDRYQLRASLGAGLDGAAYLAADSTGRTVEVRLLSGAVNRPGRMDEIRNRLLKVALLDHPGARHLDEIIIDAEPPVVVLDGGDDATLEETLGPRLPLPMEKAIALARELAETLAAIHRLGLAHGRITPAAITVGADGAGLRLDLTGIDTCSALQPECAPPSGEAEASDDLRGLGIVLGWLLTGRLPDNKPTTKFLSRTRPTMELGPAEMAVDAEVEQLIDELMAQDVDDRPTTSAALARLSRLHDKLRGGGEGAATRFAFGGDAQSGPFIDPRSLPRDLGRYTLTAKLGSGGMGTVFMATDRADGRQVAVKLLNPDLSIDPHALARFHKEARLLKSVNNPFVANLLEHNEDQGLHYIVMEYVPGRSLRDWMDDQGGTLDEALALTVVADVARALADAHERGIVHRDIKPENILIAGDAPRPTVKLTDFGLARQVEQSQSLALTATGGAIGTPFYMAPEQGFHGSGTVDPRSDIYALGATLFHLLAGQPPFLADSPLQIMMLHANEPPPLLRSLAPQVSEGTEALVRRCLAKSPGERYSDAGTLLRDLERLRRGEPTGAAVHPLLPSTDPARVLEYIFHWDLEATPRQLWPHVSNTERLNRAIGLPAVTFRNEPEVRGGSRRFGHFSVFGVVSAWEEHPFEWIEGRRLGVLRTCSQGPFRWLASSVELQPRPGGGTHLVHTIRVEPRGWLGRIVGFIEISLKARRALRRVYERIDAAAMGRLGRAAVPDAFEAPPALSGQRRRRLDRLLAQVVAQGVDERVVERLGEFLATAPDQEVARIRPLALARRLGVNADELVAACLHGSREGLLVLLWDLVCPICRIPAQVQETLQAVRDHDYCQACNADFTVDFAASVEMIFRAHPEVREAEVKTYCIGGPSHSPHVVAQVRVSAGERVELNLELSEGAYRLRGPQLPWTLEFDVRPNSGVRRFEIDLARPHGGTHSGWHMWDHGQVLVLGNGTSDEVVVRVERRADREDALTAARATTMALFRELFPSEVLSPGQLVSVASVCLLVTDLPEAGAFYRQLGDAAAFSRIHAHLRAAEDAVRDECGAVVKAVGGGVLAAFHEPVRAVRAMLALAKDRASTEASPLTIRAGVHRGPALTATLNDHLDYFGATVQTALALPLTAGPDELVLSEEAATDPLVAALLVDHQVSVNLTNVPGGGQVIVHRLPLRS